MHLSRRRYIGSGLSPTPPGKSQVSRRPRTPSVSSTGTRNTENHHKKVRTRQLSLSVSSTDDRKVAPSTSNESVEESCVALPTWTARGDRIRRGLGGITADNSLSSLPTLAAAPHPQIAWNKTFVYMYDETERKSKAVKPSDELDISLPVLVQYELTAEEDSDHPGEAPASELEGDTSNPAPPETCYMSPTLELLQKWDKTEKRNKGLHVMRWLVQVQN